MTRTASRPDTTGACCPHSEHAHTHLRAGTDCSLCDCPQWRPVRRGLRYRAENGALRVLWLAVIAVVVVAGLYGLHWLLRDLLPAIH